MKETGIEGLEPHEFDQELMQALRRVDAPAGFADRLMARTTVPVEILPARSRFALLQARAWTGGAIAAILALGIFAGMQMRIRHHQEQVVVAQQQFDTAMRVTDRALDRTRAQVLRAGLTLDK